ncbi:Acyl-CoA reductase (LuxC) [Spirosomataceae bacterium TFI 002]|nr:Acyl-CoA reductase (LuxC) [Spirosomataceae bacterium TFI 002]
MQIASKILTFNKLGSFILDKKNDDELQNWFAQARNINGWFTEDNCRLSINSIANQFLQKDKLEEFVAKYEIQDVENPKKVGVIAAGNIPFVGFHDLLCIVLSGHIALVKLSRDDTPLMLNIIHKLYELDDTFKQYIIIADRLNEADAFIATGSDNSSRYFEYYFKNKPSIIRKNRTSIAVLNGNESGLDLRNLGNDIFRYFGLGCRNISKVFVPKGYTFDFLYENIAYWNTIQLHHKYNNNYDYNKSIYLVNRVEHLDNGFLLLKQDEGLVSPLSVLFFEYYDSLEQISNTISKQKDKLQCIVSNENFGANSLGFGESQHPSMFDYADGVDTMAFLKGL